jgi:hypothetical protein
LNRFLSVIGKIQVPWDVVLLHNFSDGANTKKDCFRVLQRLNDEFTLLALLDEPCSSSAYVITRDGARRLLGLRPGTKKFDCASDHWVWLAYRHGLRPVALRPMIASTEEEIGSDVDSAGPRTSTIEHLWPMRKVRRSIRERVRAYARSTFNRLRYGSIGE